ncbi:MAG: hypothetical protein ABIO38_09175 [Luteimonas sp.]
MSRLLPRDDDENKSGHDAESSARQTLFPSYRPRTRQASSNKPKPMIHDHVAIGSPILTTPNCAASATRNSTRQITHTAIVGALPEFRMSSSFGWWKRG